MYSEVNGKFIPVLDGYSIVSFSGGKNGDSDKGLYVFWTVIARNAKDTVRCRLGTDPRERIMDVKSISQGALGKVYKDPLCIRPAGDTEIEAWMNSHQADKKYALWPRNNKDDEYRGK
jgi:hypothetical protein